MSTKKITIAEAAEIMGVSQQFVRIGLQRGLLPFGFAVSMSGGKRFTYYINPKDFEEYLGLKLNTADTTRGSYAPERRPHQ